MTAIRSGSSISSQTPSAPKCNHPSAPGSTVTACRDFAAPERTVDSCTLPNGALPVQMVTLRQTRPGPAALFGPGYSRTVNGLDVLRYGKTDRFVRKDRALWRILSIEGPSGRDPSQFGLSQFGSR